MSIDTTKNNSEAEENFRFRKAEGLPKLLRKLIGILVPISGLMYVLNAPYYLTGTTVFVQQFLGILLGAVLSFVFLAVPAHPKLLSNPKVPWYDWLLILASVCGGLYITLFYPKLIMSMGVISTQAIVFGGAMLIAILEGTRRLTGWPLLFIVVAFVLYGRFGYLLPGFLETKPTSWARLTNNLYLGADFVFGVALQIAGGVVFAFILFGQFLSGTGAAKFLLDLAQALMGKYRGGPAKVAIVGSAFMGSLSGSAVGNVASTGVITIPMMKKIGYPPYFAGSIEAVASTGGVILPPIMGAAAFIMAQLLGIPFSQVALVAIVPALLYYLGLYIQVDLRAAKNGLQGIPKIDLPSLKLTIIGGWIYIVPFIALIYSLFTLRLPPELSAVYSALVLLVIASIKPSTRKFWRDMFKLLEDTTISLLEVVVVSAAAGIVIGVLSYTGLGISFSQILTSAAGGSLLLLAIFSAVASVILGMGMPITATYLFLATLTAPAMVNMGVPAILGHLFVFYFGAYSFLTPPVCMAVYAAASIAGAPMLKTAWQAMKLAVAGYVIPFIFIFKPGMVFMNTPGMVFLGITDAIFAVFCLAVATEGYLRRPLNPVVRVLFVAASLSLFVPGWSSRIVGYAMFLALLFYVYRSRKVLVEQEVSTT